MYNLMISFVFLNYIFIMRRFLKNRFQNIINILLSLLTGKFREILCSYEWWWKILKAPSEENLPLLQGRNPSNYLVHFWKIDDFIYSFWLKLTFSNVKISRKIAPNFFSEKLNFNWKRIQPIRQIMIMLNNYMLTKRILIKKPIITHKTFVK